MRISDLQSRRMPLKLKILRLLSQSGKQRFHQIAEKTHQEGDKHIISVKTANCLNDLLEDGMVKRQYTERESWYEITEEGRNVLLKSLAESEIAAHQPWGFANAEVVESSDKKGDASVYWSSSIDSSTRQQIGDIIKKYPGIKIIGHYYFSEQP